MAKKRFYATSILPDTSAATSTTSLVKLTEGTVTGAAIGLVGGYIFAKFNNKNVYLCGLLGLMAGGIVSKVITM